MFLDLGVGILLSIFFTRIFDVNISYTIVAAGAIFSLLPDVDVLAELYERGEVGVKVQGHHRQLTHFPLTYIPVAVLIYIFFGSFWSWLLAVPVAAHFLHDSVGMGWGLKWLWPFSQKSYKFFSEKDGSFSKKIIVSWQPEELKKVIGRYGDNHWIRNFYFKLHPIAVFEFLFFILALLTLLYYIV